MKRCVLAALVLLGCEEPPCIDGGNGKCLKSEVSYQTPAASGPSKQQRAVEAYGFINVKLGGAPLFECSKDDSLLNSSSFTAETRYGGTVSGAVCCGWFKGCTVRTQ